MAQYHAMTLKLSEDMNDRLEQAIEREGCNKTEFIRAAIAEKLDGATPKSSGLSEEQRKILAAFEIADESGKRWLLHAAGLVARSHAEL